MPKIKVVFKLPAHCAPHLSPHTANSTRFTTPDVSFIFSTHNKGGHGCCPCLKTYETRVHTSEYSTAPDTHVHASTPAALPELNPVHRHPPPAPQPHQPHKARPVSGRPARGRLGEALRSGRPPCCLLKRVCFSFSARHACLAPGMLTRGDQNADQYAPHHQHTVIHTHPLAHTFDRALLALRGRGCTLERAGAGDWDRRRTRKPWPSPPPPALPCRRRGKKMHRGLM